MIKTYGKKNPHDEFQDQWLSYSDLEARTKVVVDAYPETIRAIKDLCVGGEGKLLEAGCGTAPYVIYFKRKGYDIDGVDFAEEMIARLNDLYPDLNIFYGDCANLSMIPDNTYDGYISLGVIEHLEEGPDKLLKEAHRILKPGGCAWITVPSIEDRKTKYVTVQDEDNPFFFENVFSRDDLVGALVRNNFTVKEVRYLNYNAVLWQKKLFRHKTIAWKLNWFGKIIRTFLIMINNKSYAHMIGAIAEKKSLLSKISEGSRFSVRNQLK